MLKYRFKQAFNPSCRMSRIVVRSVPGEERLQISFKYPPPAASQQQKMFNFDRLKTEELDRTLQRITTSISSKVLTKKAKKLAKSTNAEVKVDEINVVLFNQVRPFSGSVNNAEAWENGTCLQIGDELYTIQLNVPTIKRLTLPEVLMVGFPVHPNIVVEFADEMACNYVWYKRLTLNKFEEKLTEGSICDESVEVGMSEPTINSDVDNSKTDSAADEAAPVAKKAKSKSQKVIVPWVEVANGKYYTPTSDEIGCELKVECTPCKDKMVGEPASAESKTEVTLGPGLCPFERRHKYTEHLTGPGVFRFVTYNILADLYADSDYSREYLFPYCPPQALAIEYRKQLIFRELIGYNADIICLQEVDKSVFEKDLEPRLGDVGFQGLLKVKAADISEGSATFFRRSKFRLVEQHDISLPEVFLTDPLCKDLYDKVAATAQSLVEFFADRKSVLQVSVLESTEDVSKQLLVGTVHLYFHPRAAHVRLLQTAVSIRHLERTAAQIQTRGSRPSVIFCGDLNSYPDGGVHEFLTKKCILGKHADWFSGGKSQYIAGMDLHHDLDLISACGYPAYTNYVTGFNACLDYIYMDRHRLQTQSVVPLPTHDEVVEYTALPNIVFPSDHVALVCDISWTSPLNSRL